MNSVVTNSFFAFLMNLAKLSESFPGGCFVWEKQQVEIKKPARKKDRGLIVRMANAFIILNNFGMAITQDVFRIVYEYKVFLKKGRRKVKWQGSIMIVR
jgi:hypothetical protein